MPSHLRHQISFSPINLASTQSVYPTSSPPTKKQKKMTVTQTYYLAHTARGKLSSEASRGDHDLRLLVGHANLLDSLMLELHDAEREQDDWLEHSVDGASKDEPKHIQWQERIVEEPERELEFPDASDTDSDDSSDDDDNECNAAVVDMAAPLRRMKSPPATVTAHEVDEDQEDYDSDADDEEENADLALTRVYSRSHTLPELVHDSSDSEEEDSPPTTPPAQSAQSAFPLSDAQIQGLSVTDFQLSEKPQQEPLLLFDSSEQALCFTNQRTPMVAAVC